MRKKTVHVPLTLQMEEMEGGAACLTMILTFYRKQVSLDQVRSACGISIHTSAASPIPQRERRCT